MPAEPSQQGTTLPWRQMLPVDRIRPNPNNPRDGDLGTPAELRELEQSIRDGGLLQPILVSPDPDRADSYLILDGERRWAAMRDWNTEIWSVIRPPIKGETPQIRQILTGLVTSIHRKNLGPVARAKAFGRLRDEFNLTASQIARQTGVSVSTVTNEMMLLELTEETQRRVELPTTDPLHVPVMQARRAVKQSRRRDRARKNPRGKGVMGAVWEPDWLTSTHPVANQAVTLCNARGHNSRRRIGATRQGFPGACGQCWQSCIEQDYEKVLRAAGWTPPS